MSNRILAILILGGFAGAIYAFYLYFYVYYQGDLELSANLDNYQVTLYSNTVKRNFSQNCSTQCIFVGLPPVDYSLTATATGYIDLESNISIPKNDFANIELSFKREITLQPVEESFTVKLNPKEKIEAFKSKKLYKLIDNSAGLYYITKESDKIEIRSSERSIGIFDFRGGKQDIEIQAVAGSSDVIWLKIGSKHSLYHLIYKKLSPIALENIAYIKKSGEHNYLIVSNSDIFEYTPHSNTLDKQTTGNDYIEHNGQKIYLTPSGNSSTIKSDSQIFINTQLSLTQIYTQDDEIYLRDNKDMLYLLQGLE